MWCQFDWGDGPRIGGRKTCLFCAWLAWSRFRVVIPTWDRTMGTLVACLDATLRRLGGAPTYLLSDNEKTVTVEHVAGIPVRHPTMVAVGRHYGCKVESCVPYDPESKGGVGGDGEDRQARSGADDGEPARRLRQLRRAGRRRRRVLREGQRPGRIGRPAGRRPRCSPRNGPGCMCCPPRRTPPALGETRRVDDDQTIRFGSVRYSTPTAIRVPRCGVGWSATSWSSSATPPGVAWSRSPATSCPPPAIRASSTPTTRTTRPATDPRSPKPRPRSDAEARLLGVG